MFCYIGEYEKNPKYNCSYKCEAWGEFVVCMLGSATGWEKEKKRHKEKR